MGSVCAVSFPSKYSYSSLDPYAITSLGIGSTQISTSPDKSELYNIIEFPLVYAKAVTPAECPLKLI